MILLSHTLSLSSVLCFSLPFSLSLLFSPNSLQVRPSTDRLAAWCAKGEKLVVGERDASDASDDAS